MDLTPVAAAVKAYTTAPEQALVGGLDGADRTARSTAFWNSLHHHEKNLCRQAVAEITAAREETPQLNLWHR